MIKQQSQRVVIPNVRLKCLTEKAGKFQIGSRYVWVPWSQVDPKCTLRKIGDFGTLICAEWVSDQKGFHQTLDHQPGVKMIRSNPKEEMLIAREMRNNKKPNPSRFGKQRKSKRR